ncbi:MAG TPA: hypothetical protein VHQ64_05505 [Pyrinomonadaceae bacterium]|jgi:hypothetical protein|nr:hypothetical protein [Pyrinomonadaceae bacterium]
MNNRKIILSAVVSGVFVATTGYAVWVHGGKSPRLLQKPHTSTLPNITSCLGNVAVQSAFFRKPSPDNDSTELVLQLMNNSDTSIVAVSIEWISKKDHVEHRLVIDSFGADTPKTLAAAHSLYEVAIPINSIPPDADLQVGSVAYANGTDGGCVGSLKALRESKSKKNPGNL